MTTSTFHLTSLQAFAAPEKLPLFNTFERIGTGATMPCWGNPVGVQWTTALSHLQRRALYWQGQHYTVRWHDRMTWFEATHEERPTVYCVIQEVK